MLQSERELNLSDVHVDICFCIDVTGSMAPFLRATKEQIAAIVMGIAPKVKERFTLTKLTLHFAIVAYRDVGDVPQFDVLDFTVDVDAVQKKVG